jgi:hypothetical protein
MFLDFACGFLSVLVGSASGAAAVDLGSGSWLGSDAVAGEACHDMNIGRRRVLSGGNPSFRCAPAMNNLWERVQECPGRAVALPRSESFPYEFSRSRCAPSSRSAYGARS